MPRVLLTGFCAVPGPRRAGVQLRHVIRALTPAHPLDLLVVREGEQAYVERQGAVRVLRVPTQDADLRSQIQAFQRALKRQLDGADYDVVHCRDSWSGLPVLEARARLGYAVVYDLTRSPLGETTSDPELDAQYGRDEEACLLAADMVLAPTPTAVKALQGRGRPERVMLSPPGVDVDRFDWEDPPTNGPPRILYVGSLDPGRGVRVLVRAMPAIVRDIDARLVLAGALAPKLEQALRDGIRELGMTDRIEILGPIDHDQLPALYATATVCVVPAAADLVPNPTVVFPTKLLEYMACKRAIVAPKRETLAHVVEDNREALLFEPGDSADLARKIVRLLGDSALRTRLADRAYERVRRELTASGARRALRAAYQVLASRFAAQFEPDAPLPEPPRVELLSDDDFEVTLFEEPPAVASAETTGVNSLALLDDALASLDEGTGSAQLAPAPSLDRLETLERDETVERVPVPNRPRDLERDDWVVATIGSAVPGPGRNREGRALRAAEPTPSEGLINALPTIPAPPPTPPSPAVKRPERGPFEASFVAGEIDVPPPPAEPGVDQPGPSAPDVDFTAASAMLGAPESADPDTGSRTPPIERR